MEAPKNRVYSTALSEGLFFLDFGAVKLLVSASHKKRGGAMSVSGTFNSFIYAGLTIQRTAPEGQLDPQLQALDTALQRIGFQPISEEDYRVASPKYRLEEFLSLKRKGRASLLTYRLPADFRVSNDILQPGVFDGVQQAFSKLAYHPDSRILEFCVEANVTAPNVPASVTKGWRLKYSGQGLSFPDFMQPQHPKPL